jgi:hypothetical protein
MVMAEEYKGPGKFTAAFGKGSLEQLGGGISAGAVGAAVGAVIPGNRGVNAAIGGAVGATVGGVVGLAHGGITGWKNAVAGEEQFREAASHVERLEQREAMQQIVKDGSRGK